MNVTFTFVILALMQLLIECYPVQVNFLVQNYDFTSLLVQEFYLKNVRYASLLYILSPLLIFQF
jgi:hypothetical protein